MSEVANEGICWFCGELALEWRWRFTCCHRGICLECGKKGCSGEGWHGTNKGLFRCPARPDPFWREIGM